MLHYLINDPDYDLLMMIVSSNYCLSMAEDSKPIFNFGHKKTNILSSDYKRARWGSKQGLWFSFNN